MNRWRRHVEPYRAGERRVEGPFVTEVKEKIRILVADDHTILRRGLVQLLRLEPDMEIIGEAADGVTAAEMAQRLKPDVVIMDVNLPKISGVQATQQITSREANIRVIGLSMFDAKDMATFMRNAGAAAYFSKDVPAEALIAAIRAAWASIKVH